VSNNNQLGQSSGRVLSSDWTGLSRHLIAKFYTVKREMQGEKVVYLRDSEIEVHAPLTEANLDITLNWQSPFENMSPDQARPALTAMFQSGYIDTAISTIGERFGETAKTALQSVLGGEEAIKNQQGKTGITKLNSTQVFSGMPPAKFTVQALFRAWKNPKQEVVAPFAQLMHWALPVKLAQDGVLVNLLKTGDVVASLFPSQAPAMVAMEYKGSRYLPLVIESIGQPLNSPVDKTGTYTELVVPITLATLTAIDREDAATFITTGADGSYRVAPR
jgi:hypothetical protein